MSDLDEVLAIIKEMRTSSEYRSEYAAYHALWDSHYVSIGHPSLGSIDKSKQATYYLGWYRALKLLIDRIESMRSGAADGNTND